MKTNSLKIKSFVIFAAALFSSNAMAAQFNCGIFLDDNEKPSATGSFDTNSGTRTTMQAGTFVGFVQVNDKAVSDTSVSADEPLLLIGNASTDKTISIAAYPMSADVMLTLLKTTNGKQAITTCVAAGKELFRPAGI
jgi:hypothetical protein